MKKLEGSRFDMRRLALVLAFMGGQFLLAGCPDSTGSSGSDTVTDAPVSPPASLDSGGSSSTSNDSGGGSSSVQTVATDNSGSTAAPVSSDGSVSGAPSAVVADAGTGDGSGSKSIEDTASTFYGPVSIDQGAILAAAQRTTSPDVVGTIADTGNIGGYGSFQAGPIGAQGSVDAVGDDKGNTGIAITVGGGLVRGGGAGFSGGAQVGHSNATTIQGLSGPFGEVGANGGAGISGGVSGYAGQDSSGKTVIGGNGQVGVGAGGSGHVGPTYTWVIPLPFRLPQSGKTN